MIYAILLLTALFIITIYFFYIKSYFHGVIILIMIILVGATLIFPAPKSPWEEKWVCESKTAFFNITPEEWGCGLVNCSRLNEDPYVEMCDCTTTGTKVFRWCDYERRIRSYEGDADKLRGEILTNNQNLPIYINTQYNPGVKLQYSDDREEDYRKINIFNISAKKSIS